MDIAERLVRVRVCFLVTVLFFFFASACRHLRVEVRVFAGALPIRFSLLHIKV